MKTHAKTRICRRMRHQTGMTLIETVVALALLLIVSAGIMALAALAMTTTENQGHLAARTAEYGQDKMEQLLALSFLDTCTDTTVFPAVVNCGVGQGLTPGGGLNPNAPVVGYSDYVDISGNPVAAGANWQYVRVWQITQPPGTVNLIQITVLTQVRNGVNGIAGVPPQSTITCLKSSPF